MSARSSAIDERAARRRFTRAARSYAGASRLEAEVGARMLERLDYVKLAPRRILDAGSGPAREARALAARYRGAAIIALDYALAMLPRRRRFFYRGPIALCGDLARLPLAPQSVELVWCNMALHWVNEPLAAFREFEELRAAAGDARVHAFTDMHDLGDMLIAAGYSAPVMDMEVVRIEYAAGARLLEDLRASGQTNARADRPRGLAGRAFLRGLRESPLGATYEVVYGHAWRRVEAEPAVKTVRVFKRFS
ncbi:MAG: methyltransferase domain-containing protein [Betaproteobacteria bacterium]|nr:MAG: methyltransferase domain-containing protein [Betaproteobacteria bacterium]